MTIGEGLAINALAKWILRIQGVETGPVSDQEAKDSLMLLTEHAYKALSAGLDSEKVAAYWHNRRGNESKEEIAP